MPIPNHSIPPPPPFNSQMVHPFVSRNDFPSFNARKSVSNYDHRIIVLAVHSNHFVRQDFMVRFDQSASPRNSNEWVTIYINSQEFLSSAPQFSQTR